MTTVLEADRPRTGPSPTSGSTIALVRPLLGFPGTTRFSLSELGPRFAPFQLMTSLDQEGLDFIVVAPGLLFDDYVIDVPDAEAGLLGLCSAHEVEVLVLVSRHVGATPTVNLMGPLVVNAATREAIQLVLQDGRYGAAVALDARSATSLEPA